MTRRLRLLKSCLRLAQRGPRVRAWRDWGAGMCIGCGATSSEPCAEWCREAVVRRRRETEAQIRQELIDSDLLDEDRADWYADPTPPTLRTGEVPR